ncbi:MAG: GAF domain-containing protein [Pseudomonadota bacterium]
MKASVIETIVARPGRATGVLLALALLAGAGAAVHELRARDQARLALLTIDMRRHAIEAMSLTLNGNLMGAIATLGLVDARIKRGANDTTQTDAGSTSATLESVARAHEAQSVFVVGTAGTVNASWDDTGRSSIGIDVRFRPYYQMGMRGKDNVYAAVSLAREERALYFAAPIVPGLLKDEPPIGVIVARTGMAQVDRMLAGTGRTALLVSPQGVVFASTRRDWIGWLAGAVSAQRVREIRALRQFGTMFDQREPRRLPFDPSDGFVTLDGHVHAMTAAPISWNDPAGQWQLVLLDDLGGGARWQDGAGVALAAALAAFGLGLIVLRLLRSQHAQRSAATELARLAHEKQARAERRMQLAQAALRLQQAGDRHELMHVFLGECHRLFGAMQGVLYCRPARHNEDADDDGALELGASFACQAPAAQLAPGEGLLGQCLRERQARVVDADGRWSIRSGLASATPAALMMAPVILQERVLGVVELALLARPAHDDVEQFLAVVAQLAIHLDLAARIAHKEKPCPVS